jgi:hypothetical protein
MPNKTIAYWVEQMSSLPRSTFKDAVQQLDSPTLMAVVLEYLHEFSMTMTHSEVRQMHSWLHQDYPHLRDNEPRPVELSPVVSTGKIMLIVHVDDTIQLQAKTERGETCLNKCGPWWKIQSATKDKWFLRSLTRKQQGLPQLAGHTFDNMWLDKADDQHFDIIRVCPFPKEFKHREYE